MTVAPKQTVLVRFLHRLKSTLSRLLWNFNIGRNILHALLKTGRHVLYIFLMKSWARVTTVPWTWCFNLSSDFGCNR